MSTALRLRKTISTTKKSEALDARKEKAEFDKLWAEIKARGE